MPIGPNNLANQNEVSRSAHRETYQLESCLPLISRPNMPSDGPRKSIPSMEMFGLKIRGIEKELISQIELSVQVPLVTGKARMVALNKDVDIKIKPATAATIRVAFVRNENGKLALKGFLLSFNHKLSLTNPGSAFNKSTDASSTVKATLKDIIAKVRIKSVYIGSDGRVTVDGGVRALRGAIKYKIANTKNGQDIVKLDENMLVKLGIIEAAEPHRDLESLSKKFDINKLLKNIGAISHCAKFELSALGDESKISALKNNNFVQGPMAPISITLKGDVSLAKDGKVSICVVGNKSKIMSSLGSYEPQFQAHISNITDKKSMDVELKGEILGLAQEISVDTYSNHSVQKVLPRRRQGKGELPKPPLQDEFNASYGSQNVQINAAVDIKASLRGGFRSSSGQANILAKALNPYAKTQERGIIINGNASARLQLEKFEYVSGQGLKNTQGRAEVSINPAHSVMKKYPSINPLQLDYTLNFGENGKGQIKPPEFGAARLVSPLENFEGNFERIIGPTAFERYHPIGTPENFLETLKLTGAEIKKADTVKVLIDGVRSMPERLRIINEAKKTICLQTLVFKDDASGWEMAKALADAAKRGVAVYAVVDGLGNVEELGDLYHANPIYQYLRENQVQVFTYNGQVETGLRKMFEVAQSYPEAFKFNKPNSIKSIAHMLRFLDEVIQVSQDEHSMLPAKDRHLLKLGVHDLFMGKKDVSPQTAVNELKQALEGNLTTLEELFLLIKRMGQASYRWHEKYLIVDEEKAIVGGMNIADEYLLGGSDAEIEIKGKVQPAWRDTDVLLEGDVVSEVYASFRRNWMEVANVELAHPRETQARDPLKEQDGISVSMIQHRPFSDGDHKVTNFLLYNLRSLRPKEKAWFETAYFLPRGVLRYLQKELVRAAKRGVDVRILTNSEKTSDFGALVNSSVFDSRELLKAGAKIYHRNKDRMVHAKVTVLGDKLTMIGSWNFDNRSASHDSEDVCAIYDEKITQEMTEQLWVDMSEQSDEVTLNDIGSRSLGQEVQSAVMLLAGELA